MVPRNSTFPNLKLEPVQQLASQAARSPLQPQPREQALQQKEPSFLQVAPNPLSMEYRYFQQFLLYLIDLRLEEALARHL